MKRSHQIIGTLHYHRQLTTFWLTQTNRTLLLNSPHFAVAHISSYNFTQPTTRSIRDGAPKKSQPPTVAAALSGPSSPLDAATRAFFEPRLGTDLGMVRVHDDAGAASSARDVAAHAYTVGREVVFGSGLYQPGTGAGRALLAHELAHVVQQEGGQSATRMQRKARTFTIHPDHAPMSGHEVLILMAMASRGVGRVEAIQLIENDEYGCGEHPACLHGITDTSPIQFRIGIPDSEEKKPVAEKKAAAKKAAPPPALPEPDEDTDLGDRPPPAPLPAEIESALDDPFLKRFFAVGIQHKYLQLPQGQPNPTDFDAVNYIRDQILRLDEKELQCYRMFAAEETLRTWTDIAKSLHEFSAQKTDLCHAGEFPDSAPLERIRGTDALYAAIKRKERLDSEPDVVGAANFLPGGDEPGRAREDALLRARAEADATQERELAGAGFASVEEFDKAANDFRLYFRNDALRIAEQMLFESGRVLLDAIHRYQIQGNDVPKDCLELYDDLYRTYGGRTVDQLKDAHPILRNPAALHAVRDAKNPYEFSWHLTLFAQERLRDLEFVQNNLRRKKDVVFRYDAVVKATLEDLGVAGDPLYATLIREQRGKPGDSLSERLISLGIDLLLFALSFADLPIALTAAVAKAGYDTGAQAIDFQEQSRAADQGFREQPSIAPVIITPIVELAPYGLHGVTSALKGLGGTAGAESKVATAAIDDVAAAADTQAGKVAAPPENAPPSSAAADLNTSQAPPAREVARPTPDVAPPAPGPATVAAEQRLADAQAKAGTAGTRLNAAGERAAAADEAVTQAEADLAQAREEAKAARADRARAKRAYDNAKPGSKAGPRSEYTAAKNAAEKAEKKVASASRRVNSAKQARGEAARAVRRGQARVASAQEAVAEAEEQRLIEAEVDRLRKLPKNVEDLPQGWDYERFPKGPRRAWMPGDPINMPDAKGNYPVWGTLRKRIWMTRATDEIAERAAGRHVRAVIPPRPPGAGPNTGVAVEIPKEGLPWLDPIREATDKELAAIASSGHMPSRLGAEIEHARIPQRAGDLLVEAGVDANTARRVTKVGDPDNLMPTRKEIHAIVDEPARIINPNRNPTLEFSLDVRSDAPFREATDKEITDIVKAIEDGGIDLSKTQRGRELRSFLEAEKKLRPSSTWEVP